MNKLIITITSAILISTASIIGYFHYQKLEKEEVERKEERRLSKQKQKRELIKLGIYVTPGLYD